MLLGILLAFLILICIALGGVVLLQRSEGGALGMGGGPSGFMTTRGAGDLLTRTTWVLGGLLFALCLTLTILQGRLHKGSSVVDRLKIDPLSADALSTPRAPIAPAPAPNAAPANATTGFEAPAAQVNTAPAAAVPPPVASRPASAKPAKAVSTGSKTTRTEAAPSAAPVVVPPVPAPAPAPTASNTSGG